MERLVPKGYQVLGACPVDPSPGGVAQLVERVLYHSTRRAVPERSWVQSLLPTTEVEPGFSTFGGMLVPVLQLISPVCKTGTSLWVRVRSPRRTSRWSITWSIVYLGSSSEMTGGGGGGSRPGKRRESLGL
jgi:hypothetical protein